MVMEWIILAAALFLSLLLALTKSLRYAPNGMSDFELARLLRADNKTAQAEERRRAMLPAYIAAQHLKEILLVVGLVWLLFATHTAPIAALASFGFIALAYSVAARGWLDGVARQIQLKFEPLLGAYEAKAFIFTGWLAPKHIAVGGAGIASRDELRQLIAADSQLLAPNDKARLLGAFDFGSMLVADAMVPRNKIVTVDIKETVGPLLLDRLHKDPHNIFVVVKKDLDSIKGLLYMHDLSPLDPDIKEVADAIRPTVHYLPVDAGLQDVLAASLFTGRQLFIAVDDDGKTKGLITLADALTHLNGEPLPKTAPVQTHP
jgi:hypothetical protein